MTQTYSSYLNVEGLLGLQTPQSEGPEHDEMLFIVMHQVYELWFKQILHEGDHLVALLEAGKQTAAMHTLKRILKILKVMVSQVDIMETMSPLEFMSFRERLASASGFQSCQFREFEMMLGKRDEQLLARLSKEPEVQARLNQRRNKKSIWRAFCDLIRGLGHDLPGSAGEPGSNGPEPCKPLQEILVDHYRRETPLAQLAENLVDLDEGLQEWRYRHMKMVERTIGMKSGTGGSRGAEYLRTTLMQPVFPDLWVIRNEF